jgi:alpha-ribazole phosphatase
VRLDPRLRERGFGSWEGLTGSEIEERHGDALERWRAGEGPGAHDAEPYDAFAERIRHFLDDILEGHPRERVLVVAHGGSIRVIHALATGLDYVRDHRQIPALANCAVARYAAREGKLTPVD